MLPRMVRVKDSSEVDNGLALSAKPIVEKELSAMSARNEIRHFERGLLLGLHGSTPRQGAPAGNNVYRHTSVARALAAHSRHWIIGLFSPPSH